MKTVDLSILYKAQQMIADSKARFKVLACGRRFGKTKVAMDALATRLLDGQQVAYFAPTFRMGAEVWREMKTLLSPVVKTITEHEWRMELHTGGVLECWSLANQAAETVRGRTYHYVVVDEAALLESAAIWQGAIRPLLTDFRGGALFASTPRGRNWFWQLYLNGQDAGMPEWESWRLPTTANPSIPLEEVAAARRDIPERYFQQEYEATFLDDGGAVFRQIEPVCSGVPREAEAGERYVFGVDWGKEHDFTAISVMNRAGEQVWLERFNQVGWALQRGRLAALYERYRPHMILAEENSVGSVNIEALRAEGLPIQGFQTTFKSKGPLIEALALAMERGEVTLLNEPVLKHELMAYALYRTSRGWGYSAPSGGHDDTVMATALSLWAMQRYGAPIISFA
jgi:Terminase RNaseH-like domain